MKIAAVISRISTYKLVGPIIDAALTNGAMVDCWHDYSHPSEGAKSYLFPAVARTPTFKGSVNVKTFRGADELAAGLAAGGYDAVLSIGTRQSDIGDRALGANVPWCLVQSGLDTFLTHPPSGLLSCDRLLLQSPWWLEWAEDFYRATSKAASDPLPTLLASRAVWTGFAEADVAGVIDAAAVRARWGIPKEQPVVLLLPFPQGVGKQTFWPKSVFGEPSRLRQLFNIVRRRRFEYIEHVRRGWSDAAVVGALRAFCNRNGAFLLVKSREKTPIPPYLHAAADKALYDEGYYPPTILEAMAIADVCVNYFSLSVLEAVSMGVPNLCITFDAHDYLGDEADMHKSHDRFFITEEGGPFAFAGVSTTIGIGEALDRLPSLTLDSFRVDPEAREAYLRKYLGSVDGAAARSFAAIAEVASVARV